MTPDAPAPAKKKRHVKSLSGLNVEERRGLAERFEAKIERIPFLTCWVWVGGGAPYGRIGNAGGRSVKPATLYAHRVAYELYKEPIPPGLSIDHLCRNPWCVNPNHLEAVPISVNTLRGNGPPAINSRKITCHLGHLYSEKSRMRNGKRCRQRRCAVCLRIYLKLKGPRKRGVGVHNKYKTHCKRGHAFVPENTLRKSDGRACRTCARDYHKEWTNKHHNGVAP